ncbi:MAG TPA: DNA primase [Gaiellaceae bacterium]|nr:DNA primase [Gaiellaceae bacterium]
MARIQDSSVEAVKAAADIVAVAEERTSLRKQGARLVGRCPFHEERTPSFSVNPSQGLYYCFGCHKGGDVISFVRETQGLDFTGAIEWLADRFRVPLEYEEVSPEQAAKRDRRARLHDLLEHAATYYQRALWETEVGSLARDYLKGRGFSEAIAREFRLGLSLGGDSLSRKALAKGFTPEELRAAGLQRPNGADVFQRRLMFPLADARGRVLGFQARKLYDDDPLRGKYVNTQESELFHKSAVVYGLDKARAAIAKQDRACVVEGNADVLALRQAGFEPVVACMGTALTEQQLRELGRLTKRLWLAFDGDAAGESAALRGMELAVASGFDVNVVALPAGADPADDPSGFESRLRTAEPYVVYRARVELDRAEDRETGFRRVKGILDGFPEGPDKLAAQRLVTDRVGTTVQFRTGAIPSARAAAGAPRVVDAGTRLERNALAGVLAHPALRPLLAELTPAHFYDPLHREIRAHILEGAPLEADGVAVLAELDARAEAEGIDASTGEELLLRLRERELRRELQTADLARTKKLQELLQKLHERVAALSSG